MKSIFFPLVGILFAVLTSGCLFSSGEFTTWPSGPGAPADPADMGMDRGPSVDMERDRRDPPDQGTPDLPAPDMADTCIPQSQEDACRDNLCETVDNCGEELTCPCRSCNPDAPPPTTGCDFSNCCSLLDDECGSGEFCAVKLLSNRSQVACTETEDCPNASDPRVRCSNPQGVCVSTQIGTTCEESQDGTLGPSNPADPRRCSNDTECDGTRRCTTDNLCTTLYRETAGVGEPCFYIEGQDYIACTAGLFCLSQPGASAVCIQPCELSTGRGCPAGQWCGVLDNFPLELGGVLASQGYGFCVDACM